MNEVIKYVSSMNGKRQYSSGGNYDDDNGNGSQYEKIIEFRIYTYMRSVKHQVGDPVVNLQGSVCTVHVYACAPLSLRPSRERVPNIFIYLDYVISYFFLQKKGRIVLVVNSNRKCHLQLY